MLLPVAQAPVAVSPVSLISPFGLGGVASNIGADFFVPPEILPQDLDGIQVVPAVVEGLRQYLVPPIITQSSPIIEGAAHLMVLTDGLVLAGHRTGFRYPTAPKAPFLNWRTSSWRAILFGIFTYGSGLRDDRRLDGIDELTRHTEMGPLTLAVDRAIQRNLKRGVTEPAQILEIGAGQRFVPWGIKRIFGDKVRIHELSLVYGGLENGVDETFPAGGIDSANLPPETFEFVYSNFGSYHGKDQLAILQMVVSSLKEGGEAYLMWPHNSKTDKMADLIRKHPLIFQEAGLDIAVSTRSESHFDDGTFYFVSLQKRERGVDDIKKIFERAGALPSAAGNLRVSLNGPYILRKDANEDFQNRMISIMAAALCRLFGINIQTMEYKLTEKRSDSADSSMEMVIRRVRLYLQKKMKLGGREPLSIMVARFIGQIIPTLNSGATVEDMIRETQLATAKDLESLSRLRCL